MAFDPDAYLASKSAPSGGFDPDAYLAAKAQQPQAVEAKQYGVGDYLKYAARVPVTMATEAAKGLASIPALAADIAVTMPMTLAQKIARMDLSDEERAYLEQVAPAPESALSMISRGYDAVKQSTGLYDSPETTAERYIGAASRGVGGAVSGIGAGQLLAQSARPAVAAVGDLMRATPMAQAASGASAGVGGQLAADQGVGPGGQALASLAAGVAGGMAVPRSFEPQTTIAQTPQQLSRQAPTATLRQRRVEPTMQDFSEYQSVDDLARAAAESNGLNWGALDDTVKAAMTRNADEALNVGTDLTPDQLGRLSVYQSLKVTPTKAMITRSFDDYFDEESLRRQPTGTGGDVSQQIRDLYAANNRAFREQIRGLAPEGVSAKPAGQFGASLRQPIVQGERRAQGLANRAYERAMTAEGKRAAPREAIDKYLRENAATLESRPASQGITDDLKKYGLMRTGAYGAEAPGAPFTLENLGKVRAIVNDSWKTAQAQGDKRAETALNGLRGQLDTAMDEAGGELFKAYNKLRTAKGQRYEGNPIIDQLIKDKKGYYGTDFIEDSQVFDKALLNTTPEQFGKLWERLTPKARNLTRAQVANYIDDRVFANMDTNEWADPVASASKLNAAINKLGTEKIKSIFGEEKAQRIDAMNKALRDMSNPPRGTRATGSAPQQVAMMRALQAVLGSKLGMLAKPIEAVVQVGRDAASRSAAQRDFENMLNIMPYQTQPQPNRLLQAGQAISPLLLPAATIQNK